MFSCLFQATTFGVSLERVKGNHFFGVPPKQLKAPIWDFASHFPNRWTKEVQTFYLPPKWSSQKITKLQELRKGGLDDRPISWSLFPPVPKKARVACLKRQKLAELPAVAVAARYTKQGRRHSRRCTSGVGLEKFLTDPRRKSYLESP